MVFYIILYVLYNIHYYPSRAIMYNGELEEGFSVETVATDGNR